MRVLIDTNILISYLLSTEPRNTIPNLVNHCITSPEIKIVTPNELLQELRTTCREKEYLREKITPEELETFIDKLVASSLVSDSRSESTPYSRDPKDDYLIYAALVHHVEFLVTGDDDLLAIRAISTLRIVSPVEFARTLRKHRNR